MITASDAFSEDQLVEAARDGDRAAFDNLAKNYRPMVYSIGMRRFGNHLDAEDLAQDVFLIVLQKFGQIRDPASFGGWVKKIAANRSLNKVLRKKATPAEFVDSTVDPKGKTSAHLAVFEESRRRVRKAVYGLKDLDRRTIIAFYFRGMRIKEMAARFGVPIGTIKRRLHVARKRLGKVLEDPSC